MITGNDISAALTVSFLTIAAGSAFGVWTGVGATLGMLSMAVASIVGVVFGGISIKTSGPTGPTAGLMFTTVAALSASGINTDNMMVVLLGAALLLFIISLMPIEKLLEYIPYVSIAIFVNGVSLFIIYKQLLKVESFNNVGPLAQIWETGLAVGTLILLTFWPRIAKKLVHIPGAGIVSGSLAAMVIGGLLIAIFSPPVNTLNIDTSSINELLPDFSFVMSLSSLALLAPYILKMTFVLAFITVVTARALHDSPDYTRELRNQGLANAAVAAIGGIPVTIGFVRTKLLKNAGATSPASGVLVGVFVITAAVFFDFVLSYIPTSIFIGILIKAGVSSMDFQVWKEYRSDDTSILPVLFVTAGSLLIIWFDIVAVFITSVAVWWLLSRLPLFKNRCPDIKTCPCVG